MNKSRWICWLLGLLLFLAPLFRSGKPSAALMALELIALLMLVLLWWTPTEHRKVTTGQTLALIGLMILPLLYLVPLPVEYTQWLPGRADHIDAMILAGGKEALGHQTLSLYPRETFSGWLVLLLPLAAYLAARSLETSQLSALVVVLFVIAGFQSVLGLIQFGTGPESPFYLGMTHSHFGSAVGTYKSRNNYVGLLYMVLMISMALFMATLGQHRARVGHQTLRQRLVYLSTLRGHRSFLFAAFSLLLLLAIIFSRSRAGIALTMGGILLASVLFSRRIGGRNAFGMTGTIVAVVLGLGISIGLAPVLDRFSASDPLTDGRWRIFQGTWHGVKQLFPVGSGPATFRETFFPYQDLSQASVVINQAHNDYLEWLYDGGLLAAILIAVFILLYIGRWFSLWKPNNWGEFRYVQVGAGIAMLLMLLHEVVDYNLFIPANMVFFSFFAGLFFHQYEETRKSHNSSQRGNKGDPPPHQENLEDPAFNPRMRGRRNQARLKPVPNQNDRNPFMD